MSCRVIAHAASAGMRIGCGRGCGVAWLSRRAGALFSRPMRCCCLTCRRWFSIFTELRRRRPQVRVVLMSGFNAQDAMVRFTGKGLASFLQKPFTVGDLRNVLQAVMA